MGSRGGGRPGGRSGSRPGPSADLAGWCLSPRWAKGVGLVEGAGGAATQGWALRGRAGRGPYSNDDHPCKRPQRQRPGRCSTSLWMPGAACSCRRQEGPSPGRVWPCDTSVQTWPPELGAPHLPPVAGASLQLLLCCSVRARQASLSSTISQSSLKLMSLESVMPSNHLILCRPLLLMPSIFPSIRGFSTSQVFIRWPKYWSFSFSISPSKEYSGLISFRMDWLDLLAV